MRFTLAQGEIDHLIGRSPAVPPEPQAVLASLLVYYVIILGLLVRIQIIFNIYHFSILTDRSEQPTLHVVVQ